MGRNEVLEELESGFGPVNADGTLRRGYFFPVSKTAGLAVLGLAGLKPVEKLQDSRPDVSLQLIQGSTDRLALTAVRAEQRFLRRQQIQRWGSVCCLCGSSLPEELLVGAHIKPRSACTEAERMDTVNIAMLACLLGCDALYELGYVVVGSNGIVERGIRRSTNVEGRVEALLNRRCSSFTNDSREYFEWHRGYHMNRL